VRLCPVHSVHGRVEHRELGRIERETHRALLARRQMHAREPGQLDQERRVRPPRG